MVNNELHTIKRERKSEKGRETKRGRVKKDRQTKAMQSSAASSKNSGAFRRVVQFETIAHYTN